MKFIQRQGLIPKFVMGSVILMWACTSQSGKDLSPLQVVFQAQLAKSCQERDGLFVKTVTHFVEGELATEETLADTLYSSVDCPFKEELGFLLKQAYDDPIMQDKFEIQMVGDTMIARLIPSEVSNSEIQLQKTLRSEEGNLSYVETHIARNTWLYKTRIRGWLKFDSLGRYQAHEVESFMEVASVNKPFHALVRGKWGGINDE